MEAWNSRHVGFKMQQYRLYRAVRILNAPAVAFSPPKVEPSEETEVEAVSQGF